METQQDWESSDDTDSIKEMSLEDVDMLIKVIKLDCFDSRGRLVPRFQQSPPSLTLLRVQEDVLAIDSDLLDPLPSHGWQ